MKELRTVEGQPFFVDDEDAGRVAKLPWRIYRTGNQTRTWLEIVCYRMQRRGKGYFLSEFIIGENKAKEVKRSKMKIMFIDSSDFNYTKNNIIIATHSRMRYLSAPSVGKTSMFKGVGRIKRIRNPWQIHLESREHHVRRTKCVSDEIEGAHLYDEWALDCVGLPCFTNFIDGELNPWFISHTYRKLNVELCPRNRHLAGSGTIDYRGVAKSGPKYKAKPFTAWLTPAAKTKQYLGYFATKIEAATAFDVACWKEFQHPALLNFPERIPEYEEENASIAVH